MNRLLHFSFFIIVLLVLVSSIFLFTFAQKEEELANTIYNDIIPGALAMSNMQAELSKISHFLNHTFFFTDNSSYQKQLQSSIAQLLKQGNDHYSHEQYLGTKEVEDASKLVTGIRELNSLIGAEAIQETLTANDIKEQLKYKMEKIHPLISRLNTILEKHKNRHVQRFLAARHSNQIEVFDFKKSVLLTGLILFCFLLLTWFLVLNAFHRFMAEQEQGKRRMQNSVSRERRVQEEMARLSAAIEQVTDGIVITDTNGIIKYVNPAFTTITGYSRSESIGKIASFFSNNEKTGDLSGKIMATLQEKHVWRGHFFNTRKDGTPYEEEIIISPVKNTHGEATYYIAVKRDVTEKISLEKQLRQAMKMEAIGTLAGGIAHDFNNILSAILGYSEIAQQQLTKDDPVRKDLDQVITAGHRATELVKQILTFSRQVEDDFQPTRIQPLIKEVLKLLRASLPSTIKLQENISQECGAILADPTQIHQVLMNLFTNAQYAIGPEPGTITISLSEIQISHSNIIAGCPRLHHGRYLDIEITDTGCGMDGLTLSKIFDPFFTSREIGEGTGLGLSVVHGIIMQHKGEITASSEPGNGTTFHIYLPVIEETITGTEEPVEEKPRGTEKILVVDDEEPIARIMQRSLINLGYRVTVCTSSPEALEIVTGNPDEFDLLITDMTMPEMTGTTLARKILEIHPEMPVILCTGYSDAIDDVRAKSFGIRDYIRKPVDTLTLAKAIRAALEEQDTA